MHKTTHSTLFSLFFFSSRRRHTRSFGDWSSDVCSSDLLLLRRCSGKGLHLGMTGEPRGFSRVAAGFSSDDGEFRLPLVLAQASPIFHSSCEGKLGIYRKSV